MRGEYLLISILLLSLGCGGAKSKAVNAGLAQDLIVELPHRVLEEEDVEIKKVTQVSGTEAIAETQLKAAFRLERVSGRWVVREVRLGHGQWEKIENLAKTLQSIKTEETRNMLERIAEAVKKYREVNGNIPPYRDYITLSDLLSPRYLTPLIRLDAWRRPFGVKHVDETTSLVLSAGPDGSFNTPDDIQRAIPRQ